jgi:hypothetical protein
LGDGLCIGGQAWQHFFVPASTKVTVTAARWRTIAKGEQVDHDRSRQGYHWASP